MDDQGSADGNLVSFIEARRELGLSAEEFETALQVGELWAVSVPVGPGQEPRGMVPRGSLQRLLADEFPVLLKERLRLVGAITGSELLGITRERFVRLAKAGCFRPARWYLNRYRAIVWLYPVHEVLAFALDNPDWLTGRLPQAVREGLADGLDRRAAGWRTRRTGLLARHAPGPWHEAAAWFTLIGDEEAADLLPDVATARRLEESRPKPPPSPRAGRRNVAGEPPVPGIADDLIEIAHARLRMTIAIERAQKSAPLPPPTPGGSALSRTPPVRGPEEPDMMAGTPDPVADRSPVQRELPDPAPAPAQPRSAGMQPVRAPVASCGEASRVVRGVRPAAEARAAAPRRKGVEDRPVSTPRVAGHRPTSSTRPGGPRRMGRRILGILRRAGRSQVPRGRR